jgi:uncharacterized protein YyaL (SSP411 family)
LQRLTAAWGERRAEVEKSAEQISQAMGRYLENRVAPLPEVPSGSLAGQSLKALESRFDGTWGGFGGAPKFPSPSNLFLALELAGENPEAARMLAVTLDQMARGGIYDQLAGGFHRYATDDRWLVPHFEKMLYDNGSLLELYAREFGRTGDAQAERIVRQTAAFLAREMTAPEGGLWSAIDAETDGHEGAYYVWTREELDEALGAQDAAFLAPLLGFDGAPFFEGDHYVLHLPKPLATAAAERKLSLGELLAKVVPLRQKLLEARNRRPRPLTDDKVMTDWNGIAIAGLAIAGRLLKDPALTAQASRAADFVLGHLRPGEGPLLHSWRQGQAKIPAYLSDYAFFVHGLLALHEATGEARWLSAAQQLTDEQVQRLRAPDGGFYGVAEDPDLLFRGREVMDGAIPSANAVAVLNLLQLAERSGEARWRPEAATALKSFGQLLEASPEGLRMMTIAARRYHQGEAAKPAAADSTLATKRSATSSAPPSASEVLAAQAASVVQASLAWQGPADGEGWRPFRLRLVVAAGWHINANPASQEFLVPTQVDSAAGALRQIRYPEGKLWAPAFSDEAIRVYGGTVEIEGQAKDDAQSPLSLQFQPCEEDRCLPPVTRELKFGE